MNKGIKITLITVIALFVAVMAFYPSIKQRLGSDEKAAVAVDRPAPDRGRNTQKALPVNALIVKPAILLDEIRSSTATIYPDEQVELAFESAGKITNIFFQEGSAVKKGDLLAKINDAPLQAELKKLEAQTPLAEDRVFRQKSLLEKDAVSKEAYEQVQTDLEKLKADIALVKAQIAQTELRAPFDGFVGLRNVSEGAYAATTTIITTLTKVIPLKVEFSINEKDVNNIKPGTKITFKLENDLTAYSATVYALESKVDPKTYTCKVRALYPNADGKIFPGRSASISIRKNEIRNAIVVPTEAVVKEMGHDVAYLYSNGHARRIELETGIRTEAVLQVLKGLSIGDTILTSGIMQLREGLDVEIGNIVD
jgi:membrane fusion protein (multidrug efflux system)